MVDTLARGLIRNGLTQSAQVAKRVSLTNDGSPSTGAKLDGGVRVLFGHEKTFEDNIGGLRQTFLGVDALHFVGVIDTVRNNPVV